MNNIWEKPKTEKEQRKEILFSLLEKLKKVNQAYQRSNEEQKGLLLKACKGLFAKLEEVGLPQVEAESLVIGGNEFLRSLYGEGGRLRGGKGDNEQEYSGVAADEGDIRLILG